MFLVDGVEISTLLSILAAGPTKVHNQSNYDLMGVRRTDD